MVIIAQGILGGFSGKVGNVIGATWKGISYIRIKPVSVANPRTEGQVNQRNKFSATLAFLQPSLAFLKVGYKFYASKQSAFNAAMSYVIQNAITGAAPNFSVDYANALVSRGKLEGVEGGGATEDSGTLEVTWDDNSTAGNARGDDKVMLLVYNSTTGESKVVLEDPATRADGIISTAVTATSGDLLQVYLAFQAADGSMVSNSTRVAAVQVG